MLTLQQKDRVNVYRDNGLLDLEAGLGLCSVLSGNGEQRGRSLGATRNGSEVGHALNSALPRRGQDAGQDGMRLCPDGSLVAAPCLVRYHRRSGFRQSQGLAGRN